jgi:hypothetical protein
MHVVISKRTAVTLYSNRQFFRVFPFEQVNEPSTKAKKLTGRVIRRARQTRVEADEMPQRDKLIHETSVST